MPPDQHDSETRTILIVEDDESTGYVMEMVIEQETAYRTRIAKNGKEALSAVKQCKPHLLILDYRLPDITGIELYDRLKAMRELGDIPTILVSASRKREEIEPRDVVFLEKPFDLDDFLQTIERMIVRI